MNQEEIRSGDLRSLHDWSEKQVTEHVGYAAYKELMDNLDAWYQNLIRKRDQMMGAASTPGDALATTKDAEGERWVAIQEAKNLFTKIDEIVTWVKGVEREIHEQHSQRGEIEKHFNDIEAQLSQLEHEIQEFESAHPDARAFRAWYHIGNMTLLDHVRAIVKSIRDVLEPTT